MALSCASIDNWFIQYTTCYITIFWTIFFTNRRNALTRDLTMWLLDSVFFNVFMPNIVLPVAKLLDFKKLRNKWHLPASDLDSKYCLIIYEQWRRIVCWGILPSMEDKTLLSTCMNLGVHFLPCEIEGVAFKFWIGDWTTLFVCWKASSTMLGTPSINSL